jgi:hypothetical protein
MAMVMIEFQILFDYILKSIGNADSLILIISISSLFVPIIIARISAYTKRYESDNNLKAIQDKNRTDLEIERLRSKRNIIPP